MGFTDMAKGAWDKTSENAKENTGFADKAVLEIYDLRKGEAPIVVEPVNAASDTGSGKKSGNTGGAKNSAKMGGGKTGAMTYADQRVLADIFKRAAGDKTNSAIYGAGDDLKKLSGGSGARISGVSRKLYTVQFNPNSIQISAHGGGLVKKNDYQKQQTEGEKDTSKGTSDTNDSGLTYGVEAPNIILSVSLLFDSCRIADAFMMEKFNPSQSLTTLGKSITTGIGRAKGKVKVSVQEEVEGFIGMIRNRHTRYLTFHWGDFSYTGVVTSLDVQYTMFNIAGQPVRATVNMRMLCLDNDMKGANAVWAEYYQQLFKELTEKSKAEEVMSGIQANSKNWLNL